MLIFYFYAVKYYYVDNAANTAGAYILFSAMCTTVLFNEFKQIIPKYEECWKILQVTGIVAAACYLFIYKSKVSFLALVLFIELYRFPADTDAANLASAGKNAYSLLGAVMGIVIAFPIEKRFINFETDGKWYVQLIKLVFGLVLTVCLKAVLKTPLNMLFSYHAVSNAVRYAIVVIFAVAVWPLSFPLISKIGKNNEV